NYFLRFGWSCPSDAGFPAGPRLEQPRLVSTQACLECIDLRLVPQDQGGFVKTLEQRSTAVLRKTERKLLAVGRRHKTAHQIDCHERLRRRHHGVGELPGLSLCQHNWKKPILAGIAEENLSE